MSDGKRKTEPAIVYPRERAGVNVVERTVRAGTFTSIISILGNLIGSFSTVIGTRKSYAEHATPKNLTN